jgi:Ca2+-binding RTX toxin-like protein
MLGINLSGAEFGGTAGKFGWNYTYPTLKEISFYAEQGLSLVRLPVRWERLQPTLGGELDKAELGRVKQFLDDAAKAGVQVIVDVHNFGDWNGKTIGSKDVPIAKFADFWTKLAGAIGDKPALLGYDLMNEPHGMPSETTWPEAAQAATDAIRKLGDKHTIFVEGESWAAASNWAANNPFLDVKDPLDKIVYEAHVYFDKNGSGTYQGTYDQEKASPDIGVRRLQSFVNWLQEKDAKGFIGEFGAPSDDPRWQVVLDNFLDAMEQYNLSGTYWGAGSWFNGYNVGLLDKKGQPKASLATLVEHVADNLHIGVGSSPEPVTTVPKGTAGDDVLKGTTTTVTYDGKAGTDTVDFSASAKGITASLADYHFVSIENLTGSAQADKLTGNALANVLTGNAGDDVLDGGAGADTMIGGDGADTYYVDNIGDRTVERLGEGKDTVVATLDWTLGAYVENLTLANGAVKGTGNELANTIIGNAAANTLTGLAGDDVLDGRGGADTMIGGTGDDTYYVDNAGDVIVEKAKEGTDTVIASLDWTLTSGVEKLVLVGAGAMKGTGTSANDIIVGNDGVSTLYGLAGKDTLYGGAGNDRLEGGADDDTLYGGDGNDVLIGGNGRDWMTGGAGADRFVYSNTSESKSSGMDRITDFQGGIDKIDLSAMDASTKAKGDQAFTFIGTADFSRKAGELRIDVRDDCVYVRGDVNGDGVADFVTLLENCTYKLKASDFIL